MAKTYKLTFGRRIANRIARRMARSGKGPASEIHTVGRVSGRRIAVMLTPVSIGDTIYLVAPYGPVNWVRNVRADPHITLSKGAVTTRYVATEIDGEEAGHALARYHHDNERYVGAYMDVPGDHTITDFSAVADKYPVFRLDHPGEAGDTSAPQPRS